MSICLDYVGIIGGWYDKEGKLHFPKPLYPTLKELEEIRKFEESKARCLNNSPIP